MRNKSDLRGLIAANRDNFVFRALASFSEKYLRAYDNLVNWDVRNNGEMRALRQIAKDSDGDVLDVGANEGQWVRAALEVLGETRKIHSFEIVPTTFERLRKNVSDYRNVTANPFGLGAEAGEVDVYYYPESTDRTSAYHLDDGFEKRVEHCRIVKGDQYLREHGITRVSYLKIDVEGMEMAVLCGFDETLRASAIDAVQFEFGAAHIVSRHFLKDFIDFFTERNYVVCRCFPDKLRTLVYDMQKDENFAGQNFVALSQRARVRYGI